MKVFVLRVALAALVLALGIALGAGPLQEDQDRRDRALAAQQKQVADLDEQVAELRRTAQFGAAFQDGVTERLVRGTLRDRTVALVALPGADPEIVASFRTLIAAAGGRITADLGLSETLADPPQRQLVAALTSQLADQAKLTVPEGASGYERFGALLARSVGIPATARLTEAKYDEAGLGIVSGFQTADLVGTEAKVSRRAALTLVVAGPDEDGETAEVLADLVRGYAGRARVVVAGPAGATDPDGLMARLRGSGTPSGLLSTVDTVELAGARVSAVLALAARVRGTVGSYGAAPDADGAVPPLG